MYNSNNGGRENRGGNHPRRNNNSGGYGVGGSRGNYNRNRNSSGGRYNSDNRDRKNHHSSSDNRVFQDLGSKAVPELATDTLRMIPLGGQGESGRNSWIFQEQEEILLVDSGIGSAPHGLKGGVEMILPNLQYLKDNQSIIKGLVITNCHFDYSGNALNIIKELEIKDIYVPALFYELNKDQIPDTTKVHILQNNKKCQVGSKFWITPIHVAFNMVNAFSVLIESEFCRVFMSSGFKVDHLPPMFETRSNLSNLIQNVSTQGVDIYIGSSVNAEVDGYSASESSVQDKLNLLCSQSKGRVVGVTCIDYVQRIQAFFTAAIESNRKVCLVGDKLNKLVQAVQKLGYWEDFDKVSFVEESALKKIKQPNQVLILQTTQESDVLQPLISYADQCSDIHLSEGDTIVLSANQPLGTTRVLANIIDKLFKQGIQVVGGKRAGVHVDANAAKEELKFMYNVTKPRYFVPTNGEIRQLVAHAELMAKCHMNPQNILIIDNGNTIDYNKQSQKASLVGKVSSAPVFYSKTLEVPMNNKSIEERQTLITEGLIVIGIAIDSKNLQIMSKPTIYSIGNGFNGSSTWDELVQTLEKNILAIVQKALSAGQNDPSLIRRLIQEVFNKKTKEKVGMFTPILSIQVQDINNTPSLTPST